MRGGCTLSWRNPSDAISIDFLFLGFGFTIKGFSCRQAVQGAKRRKGLCLSLFLDHPPFRGCASSVTEPRVPGSSASLGNVSMELAAILELEKEKDHSPAASEGGSGGVLRPVCPVCWDGHAHCFLILCQ